ncbi:PilZ domain-containing protein [Desulfovibrio aminophilus]|uniref:PilZ domain-containing protein n=1 Tax=Desulfovibrio aminophilus TaxID=81425 RepID=UPI0033972D42
MDFDVRLPNDDDQLRKAFRTRVPGLLIRIAESGKEYQVKDLSASGFAILEEAKVFKEGQPFEFDLLLARKLFLSQVKGRVMRILDNGIVGCNFQDLDRRQEMKLDKLVLEVQKRLIELRKAKKEEL